ncbi:MAG: PAS domain S-box protein [Burkholderiales bacterium]|nr:PAS domain S-box protein [Anaerolineae bacterium]
MKVVNSKPLDTPSYTPNSITESERFLQSALDALSAHVAILDENGTIITVNAAWRRFADGNAYVGSAYGIGTNYLNICEGAAGSFADEAPEAAIGIRRAMAGELDEFYLEYPCHSPAEKRWFAVRVTRFQWDMGVRVIVAHQNITRLKTIEQELRDKEWRLRSIVDHIPSGLVIFGTDGTIESINPAMSGIFGYKPKEVVGQHIHLLLADFQPENSGGSKERETTGYRKDGSGFPVSFVASKMTLDERELFTGIVQDISERKHGELERLENERLRMALEKEREIRELKDKFLGMISHELRTPLAQILLASDMLRHYSHLSDAEEKEQYLDVIKTQVERLSALVNDVLIFTRTESSPEFSPETVNLETFAYEIVKEMQFVSKDHQIIFYSKGDLSGAQVDIKLLHQASSNLLSNAIKYSPERSSIMFEVRREGRYAVVTISDKGIGIPKADLPRLFQPFQRASNVNNLPGTGLGLAIVKQALELHDGTVSVKSKENVGTTFTLKLPVFAGE